MTTMKGLIRGLRYISQMFDNEKEEEIQIGNPTDVKHVAHIGSENTSANPPSWMHGYKGSREVTSANGELKDKDNPVTNSSSKDYLEKQKSSIAPSDSSVRSNSSKTKQSRRHKTSAGLGSPRETSNRGRRPQNSNLGSELQSQGPSGVRKHSRRKVENSNSSGGSSISQEPDPLTGCFAYSDPGHGLNTNKACVNSALDAYGEGNDCDETSREIRAL